MCPVAVARCLAQETLVRLHHAVVYAEGLAGDALGPAVSFQATMSETAAGESVGGDGIRTR